MSLVTTCPECHTAFIVKPEHLAAHRGDVRCGHCQHLFNALEHLAEAAAQTEQAAAPADTGTAPAETGEPDPVDQAATESAIATVQEAITGIPAAGVDLPESESPLDKPPETDLDFVFVVEEAVAQQEEAMEEVEPTSPDVELSMPSATEEAPGFPPLIDPEPELEIELVEHPAPAEALPEPEPEPEPEPKPAPRLVRAEPSPTHSAFLAPRKAPRGRFTWLLVLAGVLLVLGAAAQTAYFMRTELAVRFPQAKPWLVQACVHLGCKVTLPHEIDLLTIDDSDLQEDPEHAHVVLLTSTIINQARFPQAYPHLELTLTDVDDHALLRRTFAPGEYLPGDTDIEAGVPAGGEIHVKLSLTTADIKAAGYRVYITYP